MKTERVEVMVDGSPVRSWQRIAIRAAMKEACRSFSLVAAFEGGPRATHALFRTGASVKIAATGATIFNGFVDRRQPQISATDAQLTVSGRSKGQDAVDSSAKHKTGRFDKKTPLEIAKEIAPGGVEFSADVELDTVPEYQLTPGATVFREIERLCRDQGVTLQGEPDGGIKLTDARNAKRHAGALIEGKNIKQATADHNDSNRHSEITVRGQSYDSHGPDALQIEATAQDSSITRKRPLILVVDGNTDKTRVKKRAKNRRARAAGHGRKASITVVGWRDEGGTLWTPGQLIYTESESLDLAQDMLIETADYSQEAMGQGTQCVLGLVDPRAYGGKNKGSNKSGSEWSQDESDAS